jgi:hypothetical protein
LLLTVGYSLGAACRESEDQVNNATGPTDDVRRTDAALIRWQHRSGGPAQALARLVVLPAPEGPVVVLSELASNPDAVGLVTDFAGAVHAALAALDQRAAAESIRWFAHHGDFSSYDALGAPETFTEVTGHFEGGRFHAELTDQRLLPAAEADALQRSLRLESIPAALAALGGPQGRG